jgi:hypothetical protein
MECRRIFAYNTDTMIPINKDSDIMMSFNTLFIWMQLIIAIMHKSDIERHEEMIIFVFNFRLLNNTVTNKVTSQFEL